MKEKLFYIKRAQKTVELSDFTDNEDATGYVDLDAMPAGAMVLGWTADIETEFAGSTAITAQLGVSTDLDRFSADTALSLLSAGRVGAAAIAAVTGQNVGAAFTPRLTVTDGKGTSPDFGDITAGEMAVSIFYIDTRDN